ncbi:hypothetical protein IY73_03785 [Lawsonella clevelandensis]|uniref:Uncharacterized protein n=1 Tax=Lawsonella clevelandensis TaxID=1528099 RepID=A0A0M4M885_9ACTN|nr:hypothetical protein AL705_03865 [Lawsonella clevelandensis]ALE34600.1 hypothetical protein IY73_03785 [Lawsonella clevelandensis]
MLAILELETLTKVLHTLLIVRFMLQISRDIVIDKVQNLAEIIINIVQSFTLFSECLPNTVSLRGMPCHHFQQSMIGVSKSIYLIEDTLKRNKLGA